MISNHYNNQSVSDLVTKTVAIIAITLLLFTATCLAQTVREGVCAMLEVDDAFCEGHTANFPKKVCAIFNVASNVSSSLYCHTGMYSAWQSMCPKQNVNISQFCDGTGYYGPYPQLTQPCLALVPCETNADCIITTPDPNAPIPYVKPFCYDCCLFCFDDAKCQEMTSMYTNSTDCRPCFTTQEPVASDIPSQPNNNAQGPASDAPRQPSGNEQEPIASDVPSQPSGNEQEPITSNVPRQPSDNDQGPFASNVPHQQSDNENTPDGFKMSPWLYVAIAIAIVAPLVLLFVLLFRHKCAKATVPSYSYDKLNEKASVNMIEIEE